ncbi:hypothetical protein NtRootA9_01920 [Arthrobacter sp. NtRootA9]|nr:hypothetical protein NtRootA9_01920 [Arthrobacter sp. NtRootA9]
MGLLDSLKKAFSKPYKTISVAEAKELLGSGATLIDVRSAQEWRTGRAPQARHVPLDRLQGSATGFNRNRPVIAVCASGVRSASAPDSLPRKATTPTRCAAAWPPGARPANPSDNARHPAHPNRYCFKGEPPWLTSPSPKPTVAAPPHGSSTSARTLKSQRA